MYSLEGACYVLCTNQSISHNGLGLNREGQAAANAEAVAGGGRATVYAPDGKQLTERTDPTMDGLVYCDIDLDSIDDAKALMDCTGHYSRPDLLRLVVDDQPKHVVVRVNSQQCDAPQEEAGQDGLLNRHVDLGKVVSDQ